MTDKQTNGYRSKQDHSINRQSRDKRRCWHVSIQHVALLRRIHLLIKLARSRSCFVRLCRIWCKYRTKELINVVLLLLVLLYPLYCEWRRLLHLGSAWQNLGVLSIIHFSDSFRNLTLNQVCYRGLCYATWESTHNAGWQTSRKVIWIRKTKKTHKINCVPKRLTFRLI